MVMTAIGTAALRFHFGFLSCAALKQTGGPPWGRWE
jgi:hypothetical protein